MGLLIQICIISFKVITLDNHSDNANDNVIIQNILTPCFQIIQLSLMTAYFPQTWYQFNLLCIWINLRTRNIFKVFVSFSP